MVDFCPKGKNLPKFLVYRLSFIVYRLSFIVFLGDIVENRAITVTQLNNYIKGILENIPPLRDIYVKGEISN